MDLTNIITNLISSKKESDFYDFKEEWHINNVSLIHDIICLANCKYNGNRYLIIGVTDNCGIKCIRNDPNRKNTQNIIDLLRDSNFANGSFPSIEVQKININNKELDIIIIENLPFEKPYFLSKEKKEQKSVLRAGSIYTRVKDTNTPKNETASLLDTEYMWKERFLLTISPKQKLMHYLKDIKNWEQENENKEDSLIFTYIKDPNYSLKITKSDDNYQYGEWLHLLSAPSRDCIKNRTNRDILHIPFKKVEIKYNNNTFINQKHISIYEERLYIAFPLMQDIPNPCDHQSYVSLAVNDNLSFLYYTLENPEIYLTYFLRYQEYWNGDSEIEFNKEHWSNFVNYPSTLVSRRDLTLILPLIIFKDETEKDKFLQFAKNKSSEFKEYIDVYIENRDNFYKKYKDYELNPHIISLEELKKETNNSSWQENAFQSCLFAYWTYNIYWEEFKNYKNITLYV